MNQSIFHRLSSVLWVAIVTLIVLLAVYVSVGRMLTSFTAAYQQEILRELNYRIPFAIDADTVSAEWHSFTPVLVLQGLRLTMPGEVDHTIELSEGRLGLDVARSLLGQAPQMTELRLVGLKLAGELDAEGRVRIRGLAAGDAGLGDWLEAFLLHVERVVLADSQLALDMPNGEQRGFDLDLRMVREGSQRRLDGKLTSSRGFRLRAIAEGVGNPFEPASFAGELYLDMAAADLGAAADLLGAGMPGLRVDGSLALELWSSWDGGEPAAELRVAMRDLRVAAADSALQLPLDRVAFTASLAKRKSRWGLSVAGLELAQGEVLAQVPRLQLDLQGETLQVRAEDVPLAPLGAILADLESLPAWLSGLGGELQPQGTLPALQLDIADINTPAAGWDLSATFREVTVQPWHGAPGLTGASGYVELAPGGGFVALDSRQFSMFFPTVYEAPLYYDDFLGRINISWDPEAVTLSSGLVRARGEEGPVRVLFGLSIPLLPSDIGLEMDLLVGLEGTAAAQRAKYIPYILAENLRAWLAASIGDGLIAQGGFLWRGSLKGNAEPLHTVQLFFNLQDTALAYHSAWPPLAGIAATVLIDDSAVSVWADSASLYGSAVDDLSVELWPDAAGALQLSVDGSVRGPAADGLAVVNQSPLQRTVGPTFSRWQLAGELSTDLHVRLDLTDSSVPPQVQVAARFDGVDVQIDPGGLQIRDLEGQLDYSTADGFSATDLVGEIWGKPLRASVSQHSGDGPAGDVVGASSVVVDIAAEVDTADVRQWLDLDLLSFAHGQAAAALNLLVTPGEAPLLTIDSALLGITLDLPEPFAKPAGDERQLHLEIPLGGDSLVIDIDLAGAVASRLEVVDGQLRGGAVDFGGAPAEPVAGLLAIGGSAPYADMDQWQHFLTEYFGGAAGAAVEAPAAAGEVLPRLELAVEQLQVEQLIVGGKDFGEMALSLNREEDNWRLAGSTDWLRGELLYVPGGRSQLTLEHLDLAGLDRLEPAAGAAPRIVEVPPTAVKITGLRRGGQFLGNLGFDLSSSGADLVAGNLTGQIAALQLRPAEPGQLVWHQGPDSRTEIKARLYFQNLGRTLKQFGYEKVIETEEGLFDLALAWPGGVQDFSLQEASGSLRIDIGEGSFPKAPGGASGTLRVVSILNLAEIVRRLSLSHMFESGIAFDRVDGEVFFHGGTIEVANMAVQGGASSFQFSGVSAVQSKSLDGELVVTLPVASNLPWVAALTAGLPVAAGVFLLSKVFESQVNRLTSAVYTATGTWDDPQVEFDRVFDDTAAPPTVDSPGVTAAPPVVVPRRVPSVQSGEP